MTKQLVLIDGKNYCYRQHWVHRFLASKGRCTSLLFGGFNSLVAMANQLPDAAFCFVWDGEGETWRHRFSNGEYKAHRKNTGVTNEEMAPLFPQIPIFMKALTDAGFRNFTINELECDDLIGILASDAIEQNLFEKVIIHSTDEDFYQLVSKRIHVMRGKAKGENTYQLKGPQQIVDELGLLPKDWVKVRALIGDPTDNIPHPLEGVGIKTAIKMIMDGLDPTKEFEKLSYSVRCNYSRVKPRWPIIRSNLVLSEIVKTADHEHLTDKVRDAVDDLLVNMTTDSFLRNKKKLTDDNFEKFTGWILDYDLNELYVQRGRVWRLP